MSKVKIFRKIIAAIILLPFAIPPLVLFILFLPIGLVIWAYEELLRAES